jgi:DNA-binding response OmpR family regulator
MGKKILIVDDEAEIQRALRGALEGGGYQVQVCDHGNKVAQALKEYKPDLVVLDVMLPGADGYTLFRRIIEDDATSDLPIIVLSGLEPSAAMFQGFPQLAAFMVKPFDPQDLLDKVAKALAPKEQPSL